MADENSSKENDDGPSIPDPRQLAALRLVSLEQAFAV